MILTKSSSFSCSIQTNFFLSWSGGTSFMKTSVSTKALLSIGYGPSHYSASIAEPCSVKARMIQSPAGSTVGMEVCMPITQSNSVYISSWVPWHLMLGPIPPTEAPLFMDRC